MKKFSVLLAGDKTMRIEAEYFKIKNGHLIFRVVAPRSQYPKTVHAFAPGVWLEVSETDE